jgi:hypothetical protein
MAYCIAYSIGSAGRALKLRSGSVEVKYSQEQSQSQLRISTTCIRS